MADFNPGDPVVINRALVAVIETYSPETNLVVYKTNTAGGTDTTTAHISQTRIERISAVGMADTVPAVDQGRDPVTSTELPPGQTKADEITTLESALGDLEKDAEALAEAVSEEQQ